MSEINTNYPVRYQGDREAVLALSGDLTYKCAANIEADFLIIECSGVSRLILDFSNVKYINSTGIAVLIRLTHLSRKENIELQAIGLSAHYKEIFKITRLADYIQII